MTPVRVYGRGMSSLGDPTELAAQIDEFVLQADKESWLRAHGSLEHFDAFNTHRQFELVEFVQQYSTGKIYPPDRLLGVVYRLIDVKLEARYVMFDLGLMNEFCSHPTALVWGPSRPLLIRMALEQSVIGRSRVAWEKLMRAVYYLEEGRRS
jgi:hypothetical protein